MVVAHHFSTEALHQLKALQYSRVLHHYVTMGQVVDVPQRRVLYFSLPREEGNVLQVSFIEGCSLSKCRRRHHRQKQADQIKERHLDFLE